MRNKSKISIALGLTLVVSLGLFLSISITEARNELVEGEDATVKGKTEGADPTFTLTCNYEVEDNNGNMKTVTVTYEKYNNKTPKSNQDMCQDQLIGHGRSVEVAINQAVKSGDSAQFVGAFTCGNTLVRYRVNEEPGSSGGCTGGQYYCEIFRQCVPSGEQCNTANPNYVPYDESLNPSIPARVGPVGLRSKGLVPTPPIGNKGYTCRVAWNNAFSSYDTTTTCTFTGPGVNLSFMPSATTSPTFYDANSIKTDSSFKMTCRDGDTGIPQETTTVCRLNWDYVEVN